MYSPMVAMDVTAVKATLLWISGSLRVLSSCLEPQAGLRPGLITGSTSVYMQATKEQRLISHELQVATATVEPRGTSPTTCERIAAAQLPRFWSHIYTARPGLPAKHSDCNAPQQHGEEDHAPHGVARDLGLRVDLQNQRYKHFKLFNFHMLDDVHQKSMTD